MRPPVAVTALCRCLETGENHATAFGVHSTLSALSSRGLEPRARAQNPAEASNPPENPAPTGPAVPSDVKQPPPPHKPFDFTVYGWINVSFDVGNQELTTAPCITAAVGPCAPPTGSLRWLPDVASNLSRFGVRGYHDLSGR